LDEHLSEAQIERYVSRRAAVDELLATAQHLEKCWRCRDNAAAIVDPGDPEVSHVRRAGQGSGPVPVTRGKVPGIAWIVLAAVVIAAALWWWLRTV
jgi:cytoskeletal protein RodZ